MVNVMLYPCTFCVALSIDLNLDRTFPVAAEQAIYVA